jgi:hypothetical protein
MRAKPQPEQSMQSMHDPCKRKVVHETQYFGDSFEAEAMGSADRVTPR